MYNNKLIPSIIPIFIDAACCFNSNVYFIGSYKSIDLYLYRNNQLYVLCQYGRRTSDSILLRLYNVNYRRIPGEQGITEEVFKEASYRIKEYNFERMI